MNSEIISLMSLETAASLCLLVIAYKIYKMKLDTETESNCCKWLKIKTKSHNPGGQDIPFTGMGENKNSQV